MHNTHPNSLSSYHQCKADGQFANLREYILAQLAHLPLTRIELSEASGVKEGSLCQPLKQLVDTGEVFELRTIHNSDTGRPNVVYAIKGQQ